MQWIADLDENLAQLAVQWGIWIYVFLALFAMVQTGLVIGPLLPGSTVLFAAGILAGGSSPVLNLGLMVGALTVGGWLGNHLNYAQGTRLGTRIFQRPRGPLSRENLNKTQAFVNEHGRRALVLSPFVPIVRSFAPFVAGMGQMPLAPFTAFGLAGVAAWVTSFSVAGAAFGHVPGVIDNLGAIAVGAFFLVSSKLAYEAWRRRTPKVS